MRNPLIFCLICFLSAFPAQAGENDFSSLKRTATGKVDQIIDGLTILLKDEKIIRLSGIDIPGAPGDPENPYALASKTALEQILPEGTEVLIYQTRKAEIGRKNRMGHLLAHLVTKEKELWVNGYLVEKGYARVFPTESNPEKAEDFLTLEDKAITTKTGLWASGSAPVASPEQAEQLIGHVAVIEGRVYKEASVRGNIYLNFGKDWKNDFTVMISPAMRKELAHKGINTTGLGGELIRVRGYLRSYNGPFLELMHPDHMQIIKDVQSPPLPPLQDSPEIPTINLNP